MELPSDRRGWLKLLAVLVAVFVAYQVFKRLLPDIDLQGLLEDVSNSLGSWTYAIVGLLAFLETGAFVGLIAPGETAVVLAGAVAGQGATSIVLTIGVVWSCAFLGDSASYYLGHRLGREFVLEHGPKIRITRERFAQVESYFGKHGGKTILIGRFIGIVRALAPFVAGSSGMRYGAMAPYSILGTGLWATAFSLLGYFASKNIEAVISGSEHVLLGFAIFVAVVVGSVVAYRFLKVEENRGRAASWMEKRPVFRSILALGRRLGPSARFARDRLTPGGLGLEFTTALAALAVGSYVFVAYGILVDGSPGPTGTDTAAMNLAGDLEAGWLTSVAKVVTALGSGAAVSIVTLVAAAWLAWKRSWGELAVLVVGTAIILVEVDLFKDLVDRPRPDDGLIEVPGSSYPSGHATHAVVYTWVALIIALRVRPGMSRATGLIGAGILAAVAIGLSRVYLGVHYLSDVSGGWGLGVATFALLTAIAVIVGHIRHNEASVP